MSIYILGDGYPAISILLEILFQMNNKDNKDEKFRLFKIFSNIKRDDQETQELQSKLIEICRQLFKNIQIEFDNIENIFNQILQENDDDHRFIIGAMQPKSKIKIINDIKQKSFFDTKNF